MDTQTPPLIRPRRKRISTRWWFWIIVVFICMGIIAAVSAWWSTRQDKEKNTSYEIITIERRELVKTITATGVVLSSTSNLIEFVASEGEVFELAIGQGVDITIPSFDDGETTYRGTIESIAHTKTEAGAIGTGATEIGFPVRIRATDVPKDIMQWVGLSVDLEVIVAKQPDALSVDRAAIQYDDENKPYVYLPFDVSEQTAIATDSTVPLGLKRQDITLGFEGDDYVEVTAGLNEGDTVALYIPEANVTSPF